MSATVTDIASRRPAAPQSSRCVRWPCAALVERPGLCPTHEIVSVAEAKYARAAELQREEELLMQRRCAHCEKDIEPGARLLGDPVTGKIWHPRCYVLAQPAPPAELWARFRRWLRGWL